MPVRIFNKPLGGPAKTWASDSSSNHLLDDIHDIQLRDKAYCLHSVTGRVLDSSTRSETEMHVSSSGGESGHVNDVTSTVLTFSDGPDQR